MATLHIPDENRTLESFDEIKAFLDARGVYYDRWEASTSFSPDADQDTILQAYDHVLRPYMEAHGYQTADVINVHPDTPNLPELRDRFNREHTHTEDEVRFFIDGKGYFWFHLESGEVFYVCCMAGDLISVPVHTRHWFEMGDPPFVKAIRVFTDVSGWTPHYTPTDTADHYRNPRNYA